MKTITPTNPCLNYLLWLAHVDHEQSIKFKTSRVARAYYSFKRKEIRKGKLQAMRNLRALKDARK